MLSIKTSFELDCFLFAPSSAFLAALHYYCFFLRFLRFLSLLCETKWLRFFLVWIDQLLLLRSLLRSVLRAWQAWEIFFFDYQFFRDLGLLYWLLFGLCKWIKLRLWPFRLLDRSSFVCFCTQRWKVTLTVNIHDFLFISLFAKQ